MSGEEGVGLGQFTISAMPGSGLEGAFFAGLTFLAFVKAMSVVVSFCLASVVFLHLRGRIRRVGAALSPKAWPLLALVCVAYSALATS